MRRIEISEALYKSLQAVAKPFEETPEDVIRRGIECLQARNGSRPVSGARQPAEGDMPPRESRENGKGLDLVSSGGRIPHGTKLRAIYKGAEYKAEVRNAKVIWQGRGYTSISAAAVAVIQSTGSHRPTEDGWRFWEIWDADSGEWKDFSDPKDREW